MFHHTTQIRVRYAETDKMGYLYYGNYATYYEVGRAEAMRTLGFTYQEMEEKKGILMPVVSLQMRFVRPAHYDDLLTVHTFLKKLPEKFMTFAVEIFNEEKKLVNGGSVKLCFLDAQSNQTVSAPDFLITPLLKYFQ